MKPILFLLILSTSQIQAQNLVRTVISSCGDRAQLSGIIVDWTMGEVISGAYHQNISLQQGFHQRDDLLTSLYDVKSNHLFKAFPNPTSNELNIWTSVEGNYSLVIYNLQGQQVYEQKMSGGSTRCEIDFLTTGNYILILKNNSGHLAYFKLQKIN